MFLIFIKVLFHNYVCNECPSFNSNSHVLLCIYLLVALCICINKKTNSKVSEENDKRYAQPYSLSLLFSWKMLKTYFIWFLNYFSFDISRHHINFQQ